MGCQDGIWLGLCRGSRHFAQMTVRSDASFGRYETALRAAVAPAVTLGSPWAAPNNTIPPPTVEVAMELRVLPAHTMTMLQWTEGRWPIVAAITPAGISRRANLAVKAVLAIKTARVASSVSSKNKVPTPLINEADRVESPAMAR